MATTQKNLSVYNPEDVPNAENMKIGIVASEWNGEITNVLLEGTQNTLIKHGAKPENIIVKRVPGAFELTLGGQFFAEYTDVEAVILIGCAIKGETPHFDYICQSVTNGATKLNLKYNLPFIFGVLTTNNIEEAKDRADGKHGNKGVEAAITAIKMIALQDSFLDDENWDMDIDDELWEPEIDGEDFDDEDEFEEFDELDELDEFDEDDDEEEEQDDLINNISKN